MFALSPEVPGSRCRCLDAVTGICGFGNTTRVAGVGELANRLTGCKETDWDVHCDLVSKS